MIALSYCSYHALWLAQHLECALMQRITSATSDRVTSKSAAKRHPNPFDDDSMPFGEFLPACAYPLKCVFMQVIRFAFRNYNLAPFILLQQ